MVIVIICSFIYSLILIKSFYKITLSAYAKSFALLISCKLFPLERLALLHIICTAIYLTHNIEGASVLLLFTRFKILPSYTAKYISLSGFETGIVYSVISKLTVCIPN